MRVIYTIAIFLSAFLLFAVQPMVGKLVLPKLGGSPSVWNTCMVFFQALLLIGYGYAHLLTRRVNVKPQMGIHAVLLIAAGLALPIALPAVLPTRIDLTGFPSGDTISIIIWLTIILGLTAGAPFLILSATAPLLQSWFSKTNDPRAKDPYFLYAASNAGSVAGLLSYPLLIEPSLGVAQQGRMWGFAYGALVLCLIGAAVAAARKLGISPIAAGSTAELTTERASGTSTGSVKVVATGPVTDFAPLPVATLKAAPTRGDRLRWIALAAVPSSVSLGVTQYISTDIAAVPLVWVVPLLIYLISFIFAFSKRGVNVELWGRILAISCCVIAYPILSASKSPTMVIVGMHLFVLLAASMMCHGRLAKERPSTEHLTEYYFLMSLGGMVGGICNAILAPVLLPIVFEYQLAMVAAVLLRPLGSTTKIAPATPVDSSKDLEQLLGERPRPFYADAMSLVGLVVALILGTYMVTKFKITDFWMIQTLLYGVPAIGCALLLFGGGRWRFALGLLIVFIYTPLRTYTGVEHVIYTERTFFGVHRVYTLKDDSFHMLYHGTTLHGVDPRYLLPNLVPTTYYHKTGPIGQILLQDPADPRLKNIAAIGLGTGSIAAYNQPGCTMRFYEIDPAVVAISTNPALFSYLPKAKGTVEIALGDGRLEIAQAPDHSYGIIIIDAFSSDAIPTHLLTREALAIYRSKLKPGGLIAFHISNIFFDLEPVVAALADDCGMVGRIQNNSATETEHLKEAKNPSTWCVLAEKDSDLGKIAIDGRWLKLKRVPGDAVWTDDYSNILKVLNWKK